MQLMMHITLIRLELLWHCLFDYELLRLKRLNTTSQSVLLPPILIR